MRSRQSAEQLKQARSLLAKVTFELEELARQPFMVKSEHSQAKRRRKLSIDQYRDSFLKTWIRKRKGKKDVAG